MSPKISFDWHKLGFIYSVQSNSAYFRSHITRPIPIWLEELGIIRVFFSSRNSEDIPQPNYIDLSDNDPTKVVYVNEIPLLDLGVPGTFDDSGVTPTCIIENGSDSLLYYVGWKRRRTSMVTIEPSIGICKIDLLTPSISRTSQGPIIAQSDQIPIFAAAPFVKRDGKDWVMWLCNGLSWEKTSSGPEMVYSIIRSVSSDGFRWNSFSGPIVSRNHQEEVLSAPWVTVLENQYHMWFSYRGIRTAIEKNFRIGYAYSDDGLTWSRSDESSNLRCSEKGWDSEMVCYPAILKVRDRVYCFYSGNGVGKGGLGVALLITPYKKR